MKNIGIFCSASDNIDKLFFDKADELGEWLGKNNKTIVYGGANLGLMERIAQSVKKHNGKTIGVIPSIIEKNGKSSTYIDEIIFTKNLSDRKEIMTEKSDVFIALPGGIGTFDEIFHVISSATIGYHQKKIILYNIDGFFNDLVHALEELERKHFTREPLSHFYSIANNLEEIITLLKTNL